jgi:hypothetical protein
MCKVLLSAHRTQSSYSLFVWLVVDGWCCFVLREKYCCLVAGGWFVLREKYCWLVADKPNEKGVTRERACNLVVTRAPVAPQVLGLTPRGSEFLGI